MTANILLGSDKEGLGPHATLLASIMRRTSVPVNVRCYYRGRDMPKSFSINGLSVEFVPPNESPVGTYPELITQPCLDRFLGIRDCDRWDKALVLDWDQLFLCDIAEVFYRDLGDSLVGARLDEENIMVRANHWLRRTLPKRYENKSSHRWVWLGAMLNLSVMRAENFWEKFLVIQQDLKFEEQITLSLAVEGRVAEWPVRMNHVIEWDGQPQDGEAILHYTMGNKPWHNNGVPGIEFWQEEQTTWGQLRHGHW